MCISFPVLYTELYVTAAPLVEDSGTDSVRQCMWTNFCDRTLELMFPPLKVPNLNFPDHSHCAHLFFSLVQLRFLLLVLWILYLGKFFISVSVIVSFQQLSLSIETSSSVFPFCLVLTRILLNLTCIRVMSFLRVCWQLVTLVGGGAADGELEPELGVSQAQWSSAPFLGQGPVSSYWSKSNWGFCLSWLSSL